MSLFNNNKMAYYIYVALCCADDKNKLTVMSQQVIEDKLDEMISSNFIKDLSNQELFKFAKDIKVEIKERTLLLDMIEDRFKFLDYLSGTEAEGMLKFVLPRLFEFVEKEYKITSEQLIGPSRKGSVKNIRHFIVYAIMDSRQKMCSLKALGKLLGGRDHSTMVHSKSAAKNLIETEPELEKKYNTIKNEMQKLVIAFQKNKLDEEEVKINQDD